MKKSLWMIVASLFFAGMGASVKLASDAGVPIGKTVFLRCLISLVLFYLFLRLRNMPTSSRHWKAHLKRSFFSVFGLTMYFSAISLLPLATAVTLNYTMPLFVALILMVMAKGQVRPSSVIALIIGLAGVVLLLQPSFRPEYYFGTFLAIGSAIAGACAMVTMRHLGSLGESPWITVFFLTIYLTMMTFPWFLISDPLAPWSFKQVLFVTMVSIFATLGQVAVTISYQQGDALLSAALGYTQVIFSVVLGMLFWNDHLNLISALGMLTIIASGLLTAVAQNRTIKSAETLIRTD